MELPKVQQMPIEEYYTAPADKVFNEIKEASLAIWNTYSDPYRTEKVNRIADLENIKDNAWYMVAMFDSQNQAKLLAAVSNETAAHIRRARGY